MDKELKAKWLAALRGGKYKQGKGFLRTGDDCFCCLGVLCDLVHPEGWGETKKMTACVGTKSIEAPAVRFNWSEDYDFHSLPWHLRDEINMPGEEVGEVMQMNDNGKTFSQIADYIEKKL